MLWVGKRNKVGSLLAELRKYKMYFATAVLKRVKAIICSYDWHEALVSSSILKLPTMGFSLLPIMLHRAQNKIFLVMTTTWVLLTLSL